MPDELTMAVETVLSWVLLPATVCGAGGAIIHSRRKGKGVVATAFEAIGGAAFANVTMPLAHQYTPQEWHYTIFFFIGWGGLELAAFVYSLGLAVLVWVVKKYFPGIEIKPAWDGVERQKQPRDE